MKLSSKTISAIKLFIDLGEHYEDGFINLKDISNRKDISAKFLEQIIPLYKGNNLLLVSRGNQGGYKLNQNPKDISLLEIVKVTENSFEKILYKDEVINSFINDLDEVIISYLKNITLSTLIEKQIEAYSNSYVI